MRTTPLALILAGGVGVLAYLASRRRFRRRPSASAEVPSHVDRSDFPEPETDWLIASFTSADCRSCASVLNRLEALRSDEWADEVALVELEASSEQELHRRYGVDSVPLTLLINSAGGVEAWFLGPLSSADVSLVKTLVKPKTGSL